MTVTQARNQILFRVWGKGAENRGAFHQVDLVSQLIADRFPDYRAIIPKSHNTRTVLGADAFLQAVRVAQLFARDNANIVRLKIEPDSEGGVGKLHLSATSAELGSSENELDAMVEGDELEIDFDVRFLIAVLSQIDEEQVVLETTQSNRPGAIRPVGLGDEEFLHVVMPMHPPALSGRPIDQLRSLTGRSEEALVALLQARPLRRVMHLPTQGGDLVAQGRRRRPSRARRARPGVVRPAPGPAAGPAPPPALQPPPAPRWPAAISRRGCPPAATKAGANLQAPRPGTAPPLSNRCSAADVRTVAPPWPTSSHSPAAGSITTPVFSSMPRTVTSDGSIRHNSLKRARPM